MSMLDETATVERLTFFNGQRLFASDLQGIEAFHREMRWLHNQSLHQPGIGRGFAVTGERDDREVHVGPGYALDAKGREIVLTRARIEPVPPVASEDDGKPVFFDLAVSYPDDSLLEEAETREGICLPRGVVRLREEPMLCWIRLVRDQAGFLSPKDGTLAKQIQDGLRIVLARAEVLECRLRQPISLAERRSARPARQPYIACGEQEILAWNEVVEVNTVDWGSVVESLAGWRSVTYSLTFDVDTSSAGFLTTPCYSLRFAGERLGIVDNEPRFYLLDHAPSILQSTPTGFQANLVAIATVLGDAPETTPPSKLLNGWTAVWMGVE